MKIISVNIATKTIFNYNGRQVESGIKKKYVPGSIYLDYENVRGDTISNRKYHGGINKAVYAYGHNHYEFWKTRYDFDINNYGLFGENLTIDYMDERQVKVGNVYEVGEAVIEATEPRHPCYKLGLVFNNNQIIRDFKESYRCGVYFKVRQKGEVRAGDKLVLLTESNGASIADVFLNSE